MTPALYILRPALFAIGLCAGSFSTNWAIRAVRGESALRGRSRCDSCGVTLSFAQTAPVVSFALAEGACAHCSARIDPLHPVGELCGGLIFLGASFLPAPAAAGAFALLGLLLLAASIVDVSSQRLPDTLTAAAALLCAGLAAERGLTTLFIGVASAATSFALLEGLRRLSKSAYGRVGLGFGDVKLVAALALWLGPLSSWMVCLASILGLGLAAYRRRPGPLPFGPFIAASSLLIGFAHEVLKWPS